MYHFPPYSLPIIDGHGIVWKINPLFWIFAFPLEPSIRIPYRGSRTSGFSHFDNGTGIDQFGSHGIKMFVDDIGYRDADQAIFAVANWPVLGMIDLFIDNDGSNN